MRAMNERSSIATAGLVKKGIFNKGNIAFVDSRFGKVRINADKAIFFEAGLLGMPDKTSFCVADFPDPAFAQFKLLQSIDDIDLSFIVLPLNEEGNHPSFRFIEKKDLDLCCQTLDVKQENLTILLVTSIHRTLNQQIKLSVNVRAPLIIDTSRNLGVQYVFQNNKYQIRHMLGDAGL